MNHQYETQDRRCAVGKPISRVGTIRANIETERQAAVVHIKTVKVDTNRKSEHYGEMWTFLGTGFYVLFDGKHCIVTNNHVIGNRQDAKNSTCYLDFEEGRRDQKEKPIKVNWLGDSFTYPEPDFTIVQVADARQVQQRPPIPLKRCNVQVGDKVIIVQHPSGARKRLTQGVIVSHPTSYGGDLSYSASTLKGSSGSPIFDENYNLIGIHHDGDDHVYEGGYCVNEGTSVNMMIDHLANV